DVSKSLLYFCDWRTSPGVLPCLSFWRSRAHRHFHSFPTRRSSDLVTLVVVSRAPLSEFAPYKKRMGWRFKWVSSHGSDFNFDYHVSFTKEQEKKNKVYYNYSEGEFISDELPGLSVFYKDEDGDIFHTYSTYARGLDILVGT